MSAMPCPACLDSAERQSQPVIGSDLHPSRDYPELLHCSCCGAYYRPDLLAPVSPRTLGSYREVEA